MTSQCKLAKRPRAWSLVVGLLVVSGCVHATGPDLHLVDPGAGEVRELRYDENPAFGHVTRLTWVEHGGYFDLFADFDKPCMPFPRTWQAWVWLMATPTEEGQDWWAVRVDDAGHVTWWVGTGMDFAEGHGVPPVFEPTSRGFHVRLTSKELQFAPVVLECQAITSSGGDDAFGVWWRDFTNPLAVRRTPAADPALAYLAAIRARSGAMDRLNAPQASSTAVQFAR